jgi:cardiolipin synthase (CMP-forming)
MQWLNIPNALGVLRLVLAPWIAMRILAADFSTALWLLGIAGLTDALDGFLARRYNWATRLGLFLDPIADKVLMSATYLALGAAGALPWWLVGLVFGRDFILLAVSGLLMLFTARKSFPPSIWGKLSTILQIVTGLWALIVWVPDPVIWATGALTAWSGLDYIARGANELISRAR